MFAGPRGCLQRCKQWQRLALQGGLPRLIRSRCADSPSLLGGATIAESTVSPGRGYLTTAHVVSVYVGGCLSSS